MFGSALAVAQDILSLRMTAAPCRELLQELWRAVRSDDEVRVMVCASLLSKSSDTWARGILIRSLGSARDGKAGVLALHGLSNPTEIDQVVAVQNSADKSTANRAQQVLRSLSDVGKADLCLRYPDLAAKLGLRSPSHSGPLKPVVEDTSWMAELPQLAKLGEPGSYEKLQRAAAQAESALRARLTATLIKAHPNSGAAIDRLLEAGSQTFRTAALAMAINSEFPDGWRSCVPILMNGATTDVPRTRRMAATLVCHMIAGAPEREQATQCAADLFLTYARPQFTRRGLQEPVLSLIADLLPHFSDAQLDACLEVFDTGLTADAKNRGFPLAGYHSFVRRSLASFAAAGESGFLYTALWHPAVTLDARELIAALPVTPNNEWLVAHVFTDFKQKGFSELAFVRGLGQRLMNEENYKVVVGASSLRPSESPSISLANPHVEMADNLIRSRIGERKVAAGVLASLDFPVPPALLQPLFGHWAYFATLNSLASEATPTAKFSPYMLPSPQHFVDAGFSFSPARFDGKKWRIEGQLPTNWVQYRTAGRSILYCDPEGTIRGARYRTIANGKKIWVSHLWTDGETDLSGRPLGDYLIDDSKWESVSDGDFRDGQIVVISMNAGDECFARFNRSTKGVSVTPLDPKYGKKFHKRTNDEIALRPLEEQELDFLGRWSIAAKFHRQPLRALYGDSNPTPEVDPFNVQTLLDWEQEQLRKQEREHRYGRGRGQ